MRSIQACERLGIKTVFLTSEDDATDGAPTMLEPLPEADAIVSTGFFKNSTLGVAEAPRVERVIGLPYKAVAGDRRTGIGRGGDQQVATVGPLPPPWRYDDHGRQRSQGLRTSQRQTQRPGPLPGGPAFCIFQRPTPLTKEPGARTR